MLVPSVSFREVPNEADLVQSYKIILSTNDLIQNEAKRRYICTYRSFLAKASKNDEKRRQPYKYLQVGSALATINVSIVRKHYQSNG